MQKYYPDSKSRTVKAKSESDEGLGFCETMRTWQCRLLRQLSC